MGDLVQAKAMLERVIEIHHSDRRDPMMRSRTSRAVYGQGRMPATLSRRHPSYGRRLQALGDLLLDLGDHQRAMPLLQQSLSLTEELLGPDHPDCALRLAGLARAATASGDMEQGRQTWVRALDRPAVHGVKGTRLRSDALSSLAEIHIARAKLDAARPLLEQSLAARKRAQGERFG